MAKEKYTVTCEKCKHVWDSTANPEKMKCPKCKAKGDDLKKVLLNPEPPKLSMSEEMRVAAMDGNCTIEELRGLINKWAQQLED